VEEFRIVRLSESFVRLPLRSKLAKFVYKGAQGRRNFRSASDIFFKVWPHAFLAFSLITTVATVAVRQMWLMTQP